MVQDGGVGRLSFDGDSTVAYRAERGKLRRGVGDGGIKGWDGERG